MRFLSSLLIILVSYVPAFPKCEPTVHIVAQSPDGYAYGTGVVVYSGSQGVYVVTAKHVVEGSVSIKVALFEDGEFVGHLTNLSHYDHPTYDASVLYGPPSDRDLSYSPVRTHGPESGEVVIAEGRLAGGNMADGSMAPMMGHPVSRKLRAALIGDISTDRAFSLNKNAWPGHSGGPVYDLAGSVLGIVVHRSFKEDRSECIGIGPIRELVYADRKYTDNQPIKGVKAKKTCGNPGCSCKLDCKCSPCECVGWVPAPIAVPHKHEYNSAGVCPRCPPKNDPPQQRYSPVPTPAPVPVPVPRGGEGISVMMIFAVVGGGAVALGGMYLGLRFVFPWLLAQVLIGLVKYRPFTYALLELQRANPNWDKQSILDEVFPWIKESIAEALEDQAKTTGGKTV